MAAYRRVYDLRHLQADCQELSDKCVLHRSASGGRIGSGTRRLVIEYGLPFSLRIADVTSLANAHDLLRCDWSGRVRSIITRAVRHLAIVDDTFYYSCDWMSCL